MTYEDMFTKASERLSKAKVKDISEHIAVQFNVLGDGSGAFYAEIADGKINVQPYDYKDNDICVNIDSKELIAALENKTADALPFYGNDSKIAVLKPALASIPKARKKAEPKAAAPANKTAPKVSRKKTVK
ncbi:MAG: hypothetical protein IJ062_10125 [Firmicutes bacterium]|nr:hypothetical protein [Bacillota bacterium]